MNTQYDLSILIPARNEEFLARTVQDLLEHKKGKTEILVGLDGAWADPGIPDHKDVKILYYSESIGQRAMTNQLARLSTAKYVMKCDAHCAFDDGFDIKMLEAIKGHDDWTMAMTMRNLHVFDWLCPDGHRRYQGPSGQCSDCGKPTVKDIVWYPKPSPKSNSFCFDSEPHFQYFNEYCKRPEGKAEISESMSLQGSLFFLTREKYWELGVSSEEFGSWGSQGIEVAVKTWLSGGSVMINKNTWYAHCFRTAGGDFSFPYHNPQSKVEAAKKHAKNLFFGNRWPKQIRPLSWLLDRFWPVRGWSDTDRLKITEAGAAFTDKRAKKLGILGVVPIVPSPMADLATSMSSNSGGQEVPVPAVSLSELSSSGSVTSQDVVSIRSQS